MPTEVVGPTQERTLKTSAADYGLLENTIYDDCFKQVLKPLTLSLLRVINVKIPLQPHKKYDLTQYGELDFS